MIIIINNSLIIIGIPSYWQKVAVGIILLFAVSIPIYIRNRFQLMEIKMKWKKNFLCTNGQSWE